MGLLDKILDRVEKKVAAAKQTVVQTAEAAYNSIMTSETKTKPKSKQMKPATTQKTNKPAMPNSIMVNNSSNTQANKVVTPVNTTKTVNKVQTTTNVKITNNSKTITREQINAKNKAILRKANSVGISTETLLKLMNKRGLTDNAVCNLSNEEQYYILCDFEQELDNMIERYNKGLVAADVNITNMVDERAKITTDARKDGVIANSKDTKKYDYFERFNKLLGDDFEQLSVEEQRERIDYARNTILQEDDARYETEYKKASNVQKAKMQKNRAKHRNFLERRLQMDALCMSGVNAEETVRIRDGHDVADSKRVACDVKKNPSKVADKMTHDWDMQLLSYYHERGDMPTAGEHQAGVQESTSRMSSAAIKQYEIDANAAKTAFYEGKSEYPFLTEEYYTATTVGIGLGATINENMSSEEKADFLKTWDANAKKYRDYDTVKEQYDTGIKEYIENHPEAKQGIEDVKIKYQQKYGKTPEELKQQKEVSKQATSLNNIERLSATAPAKSPVKDSTIESVPVKKANELTIKSELKFKTVAEIKRFYTNSMEEIAEIILKNDVEYRNRIDDILDYLDGFSGIDIGLKLKGCSTHTISKVIQAFPRKADDILKIVAPTMCFAGKKSVERIVEEGQQNEAA